MRGWSQYWQDGASDCIPFVSKAETNSRIDLIWKNCLKECLNTKKIDGVIDIACGNGYLTKIISDDCQNQPMKFIGYDLSKVKYIGSNSTHTYDLYNNYFDLSERVSTLDEGYVLVSNFGLEYLSLSEINKLISLSLKKGLRIFVFTHTSESLFHNNSRLIINAINLWRDDLTLKQHEELICKDFSIQDIKGYIERIDYLDRSSRGALALASINDNIIELFSNVGADTNFESRFTELKLKYENYFYRIQSQFEATERVAPLNSIFEEQAKKYKKNLSKEIVSDTNQLIYGQMLSVI